MNFKLILTKFQDGHLEISLRDEAGINYETYTFDTEKESDAFVRGFATAQHAANRVIQALPTAINIRVQR